MVNIDNDIFYIYDNNYVYCATVLRWMHKFKNGHKLIKEACKYDRTRSIVTDKYSESEVYHWHNTRLSGIQIATIAGLSRVNSYDYQKIIWNALWIPHLPTPTQEKELVKCTRKLLKLFPKYDSKIRATQKCSSTMHCQTIDKCH